MVNRNQKNSNDVDNSLPSYKLNALYKKEDSNPLVCARALDSQSKVSNANFKFFTLPFHFNAFFQPGIYAIVNTQTNKCYIGEAANLADRLSRHILQLNAQKHDCIQLQKDWKLYGEQVFDFVILELGTEMWSDRIKRLKVERQYIQKYQNQLYNLMSIRKIKPISKISNRSNSIPIRVDDEIFTSISEASRHFGVSLSTIRSRLNNPNSLNWSYINKERQVATNLARAVVIDDKYYLSVSIAAAGEGISEKTVRKNIKVKSNWNYFDMLTDQQKKEIPKLDERIQVSNTKGYRLGRRVQVNNQIFSSIRKASQAFNIDSRTVRKRIESSNFVDWKWVDKCDL
jgi:hypothetical protein